MNCYTQHIKFENLEEYYGKIKAQVMLNASSKSPTILDYPEKNEVWMFFFKDGILKSSWICNKKSRTWNEHIINLAITSVCKIDEHIYALDENRQINILTK